MNVQVLQHVPFEGIGNIAAWLNAHRANVQRTCFFADAHLPSASGLDLVIAMGGPMSVLDEAKFPWLRAEKAFLRQAIEQGVRVLGICLGAQLIADVLGARVYRNPVKEIGWFAVDAVHGAEEVFRFPPRFTAFHWHGETFDLPRGAVRLARTSGCENQAFEVDRQILGLQFHLEVTADGIQEMVRHGARELAQPGSFIQTPRAICAPPPGTYADVKRLMHPILDYLLTDENEVREGRSPRDGATPDAAKSRP